MKTVRVLCSAVGTIVFAVSACGSDDTSDDSAVITESAATRDTIGVRSSVAVDQPWNAPPGNAQFDYQIGGDYDVPAGATVVSRDWFVGTPIADGYSICYVNAFQTQPDDSDVDRPDEKSNWPAEVVLAGFEDDPNWAGEFLIDIGSPKRRVVAADHLDEMIQTCADKGFDAVEYDNLDSWDRLSGLPFGRDDAIEFATMITDRAHRAGLAVGQKNTSELGAAISIDVIGFDFAIAEECGQFDECEDYAEVFGDAIIVIEYSASGFDNACKSVGETVSVVYRDLDVSQPGDESYIYDHC